LKQVRRCRLFAAEPENRNLKKISFGYESSWVNIIEPPHLIQLYGPEEGLGGAIEFAPPERWN